MNERMRFGVSLWPQYTTWAALLEAARLVDDLGYEELYTWDHFLPINTNPTGPNLEAWQILAAWAHATRRVRLGTMVSGNTYRHPAVLAKMVATLDHISNGRAILGLGAGWFELEHRQYGLQYGTAGERLDRLDEALTVVRGLLQQPTTSFQGRFYELQEAFAEPKPVQARLPILVGGGGERKTLRIVARHADMWNGDGPPDAIRHKLSVLRTHCQEVGRHPDDIVPTVMATTIVRDTEEFVARHCTAVAMVNRLPAFTPGTSGGVEAIARHMFEYWQAGVRTVILSQPAPYDVETLVRVAQDVRPLLDGMTN